MAIDDNTSYELTGAQVKDLASKINAKEDSADLATVAESGSYNDLLNKPTIPAAQVNSDWDAVSGVAQILNKPSLATVATSGSYSDLSNKPTIGNATLTIQKNGTAVDTFTANATSNKTINITVPTTAADVSALPDSTKYGASIAVSINTTDYKVTTTLKDQDGNTLGTAQVIDLPLESVVVNGSYDNANKKIVLTLQNGNTVDIPVGDLVAGLQTEITSSNKLASDLVDDTGQTNKFMTSAEKTKLSGIATGAEVNVQSDWDVADNTSDAFIKNKPTIPVVDSSLSTSSTNAIQNKAVATALNDKVDIASVNLTNQTTTILAQVQALGAAQKNYGRFYSKTDAGSANISDKPTGATNASFVCIAYQSRNNGTSDYTYQVLCWVQADTNPYKTTVTATSSSITWTRLQPTVNNATLTIQKNGTTVETFTANSSSNKTANISVPTKTSDLTNDGDDGVHPFLATDDVATVATTGDYDDLTDKPTIGNATLTIQKNGTAVDTFTANATSNKTINLTMPNITVQDTDPGEGAPLAADNYIGVYDIPASPIDGDRLVAGSVATAALADSAVTTAKIDNGAVTAAKMDTQSYSLTNTPAHSGGTNRYKVYRMGNFVVINLNSIWLNSVAKDSWTTLGTLPSGLYPSAANDEQCGSATVLNDLGNVIGSCALIVNSSGNLQFKSGVARTGLSAIRGEMSYVITW